MRARSKGLFLLGIVIALGILFISTTQLAAQEPEPTIPVTVPAGHEANLPLILNHKYFEMPIGEPNPTIPATLPVPTIPPAEPRLWLPQLYNMASIAPTVPVR